MILKPIHRKSNISLAGKQGENATLICYEVVKVGPDVKDLNPGAHCLHISTAGDSAGTPLTIVREDDIICWWNPPNDDIPQPSEI